MKKIKEDMLVKIMMIFMGVFSVLFVTAYVLIKYFLLDTLSLNSLETTLLFSSFNAICLKILVLFFILSLVTFYLLKKLNAKLEEDINSIDRYIKEISEEKKYDAVIKIKHYLELLEIAVVFKNIAKRLKQKEKKSSKK